jgi:hypothetical protein
MPPMCIYTMILSSVPFCGYLSPQADPRPGRWLRSRSGPLIRPVTVLAREVRNHPHGAGGGLASRSPAALRRP